MCFHQAAWLKPNGDLCWCCETDDHEDLAAIFKIRDDSVYRDQRAVRVELKRPEDIADMGVLKKWTMIVDETTRPDWVTDDVVATAREKLEAIVERQFVRTDVGALAGGCWIVLDGGRISQLVGGRILAVQEKASLDWANLDGANLDGASLCGANLDGASLLTTDTIPAGWRRTKAGVLVRA